MKVLAIAEDGLAVLDPLNAQASLVVRYFIVCQTLANRQPLIYFVNCLGLVLLLRENIGSETGVKPMFYASQ